MKNINKIMNVVMNTISKMSIADIMMIDSMLDAMAIKAIANRMSKPAPAPATASDGTPIERYVKLAQAIVNGGADEYDYEADECELNEREAQLDEREEELDEREAQLNAREEELDEREKYVELREDELNEREEELDEREESLEIRESSYDDESDNYDEDEDEGQNVTADNVADVRDVLTNILGSIVKEKRHR